MKYIVLILFSVSAMAQPKTKMEMDIESLKSNVATLIRELRATSNQLDQFARYQTSFAMIQLKDRSDDVKSDKCFTGCKALFDSKAKAQSGEWDQCIEGCQQLPRSPGGC